MAYIIPKSETPDVQYKPTKYKEGLVMLGIAPNGPVALFTDTDELVFCPWDEVVAFMAMAPRKQVPDKEEPDKTQDAAKPRVLKNPTKEHTT